MYGFFILFYFFKIFIVIQLQLCAFSPHPSTPPQLNPPPSPTSTLPLDFEEKSKQNITRDTEVKNNLTIAGGSGVGTVGRGDYRNYYKGHMYGFFLHVHYYVEEVPFSFYFGGNSYYKWCWILSNDHVILLH